MKEHEITIPVSVKEIDKRIDALKEALKKLRVARRCAEALEDAEKLANGDSEEQP